MSSPAKFVFSSSFQMSSLSSVAKHVRPNNHHSSYAGKKPKFPTAPKLKVLTATTNATNVDKIVKNMEVLNDRVVFSHREIGPNNEAVVYCDGACPFNGNGATTSGSGVFDATSGEQLRGRTTSPYTNNRAELYAMYMALKHAEKYIRQGRPVIIKTDSTYTIGCFTWRHGWKKNGWRKGDGSTVTNLDLIHPMSDLFDVLTVGDKLKPTIQHVRGHQKAATAEALGNEAADTLANQACALPVPTKVISI